MQESSGSFGFLDACCRQNERPTDKEVEVSLPPSVNDTSKGPSNRISTTKYTWYTFLFKNLFEQLHKFSTVYFLSISFLMYLGETTDLFVGTIKYFTTLAQQVALMCLSGAVALRDDLQRGEADRRINNSLAQRWNSSKNVFEEVKWEDIKVGNVLKVRREEEFPADSVPLCSTGERGSLFVSTANLDGETNLKTKAALEKTQDVFTAGGQLDESKTRNLTCSVFAEAPKDSIHDFKGKLIMGADTFSLGPDQLLLRGTVLRNTDFVIGVVVYTGVSTRMVLNSREAPMKQSSIEKTTNKVMFIVLGTQAILALISCLLYLQNRSSLQKHWYLTAPEIMLPIPFAYWLTFFVLYSNLMPITLYGTVDVCNFFHAYFIKNDRKMCYLAEDPSGEFDLQGSFRADVRSTNLCQELGQVSYIFSDKTGTLTQNVMELKRILIGEKAYGHKEHGLGHNGDLPDVASEAARQCLEVLAVCHTVMVSQSGRYEAESPDDEALVQGAKFFGWELQARTGEKMTVKCGSDPEKYTMEEYTIVAINAFTSSRKRMSAIVQSKNQEYLLLVKGADNVITPLLRNTNAMLDPTLSEFSREGLRTLVMARRSLDADFVSTWLDRFKAANADLGDRVGKLAAVAEEVERDLDLCGATGIEDKLQDNVPDTIRKIRKAGIKFWMLTGDKLETAKEIGFSANVLDSSMLIIEVQRIAGQEFDVEKKLRNVLAHCKEHTARAIRDAEGRAGPGRGNFDPREVEGKAAERRALMITGEAITELMKGIAGCQAQRDFLDIAQAVSIVIACRVSPLQKAQMVRIVRENVKDPVDPRRPVVTLAIGDGANDVPMIQTAEVGVGIAGKEGRQSVNTSDFAIGQFWYLERLLFLHGRWNYLRACKYTLFTFWRNAVQVFMIVCYTQFSAFSGTSLFEDSIRITFNGFASVPIVATGLFDQDVDEYTAINVPELYRAGREQVQLSLPKMSWTLISALSHSVILQLVWYLSFDDMAWLGVGDYYSFGTACFTGLLFDVFYRNLFLQYTHNKWTFTSIGLCFLGYVFYLIVLCVRPFLEPNMFKVPYQLVHVLPFWIGIITAPMIAMALDTGIDFLLELTTKVQRSLLQDREEAINKFKEYAEESGRVRVQDQWEEVMVCLQGTCYPEKTKTQEEQKDAENQLLQDHKDENKLESRQKLKEIDDKKFNTEERLRAYEALGLQVEGGWRGDIAQQTTPAWIDPDFFQTTQSRFCNCICVLVLGVILIVVSATMHFYSAGVTKVGACYGYTQEFSDCPPLSETNVTMEENCYEFPGTCTLHVQFPKDISEEYLLVGYVVGPFYQNHNDYENSEVIQELRGGSQSLADLQERRERFCTEDTRVNSITDKEIVPCGMKANSLFNDTISLESSKGESIIIVDPTKTDRTHERHFKIAWESDIDRYNELSLTESDKDRVQWLNETYPKLEWLERGVKSPRFVAWMRPSAKPEVRNRLGYIETSSVKGQNITVTISNVFNVKEFGYKKIVFAEVNLLGGSNASLKYFFFICGIICLVEAFFMYAWIWDQQKNDGSWSKRLYKSLTFLRRL